MEWTLFHIKAKVRRLTGRPDDGQLSDADLTRAINQYYVNMLPQEAAIREAQTWFQLAIHPSDDGSYGLSPEILSLENPVTVQDAQGGVSALELTTAPDLFFRAFPDGETATGRPTACLLYNRTLYVRPLADGEYVLKARGAKTLPPLDEDGDAPEDVKWGPLIAYGAAMEILQDNGEDSEADSLKDMYFHHLASVARKQLAQTPLGTRSVPGF